ncbi:MAG: hypothetical protein IJD21_07445 [Oscillospiraceae bacterium]|nr:hypothetical protein [Oscillospiraceae bacterium]
MAPQKPVAPQRPVAPALPVRPAAPQTPLAKPSGTLSDLLAGLFGKEK